MIPNVFRRSFSTSSGARDVVIASFARTPIASFQGKLASVSGPHLQAHTIKEALARANIKPEQVQEVILGNVISSNIGQAPATQAAHYAGLPNTVPCTLVNKVCASGMKAVMLASQTISLGHADVIVAGGFESMSNIPYYLPQARTGYRLGHGQLVDAILRDGLWDVYNDVHMGNCAEKCAKDYNISRADQDAYAIESYRRANEAIAKGLFKPEIAPYKITSKKGEVVVDTDEEPGNFKADKMGSLRPAFDPKGTVTAANASKLNDGAATIVLMSAEKARQLGVKPLARIRGFADAAQAPIDFTTAPALAVPRALSFAGVSASNIDYHEINEAFSVVSLANMKLMNLDPSRVNVWGGAVALGHPIGSSGARIIGTLMNVLKEKNGSLGCASICNGGGGASAVVIENL